MATKMMVMMMMMAMGVARGMTAAIMTMMLVMAIVFMMRSSRQTVQMMANGDTDAPWPCCCWGTLI